MRNTISQQFNKSIARILFALILVAVSLMPVSGVARAQVPQSTCSEIWDTVITVSNNGVGSRALRIGQGLSATADHVDNCDVPAPPMPPSAFEAEIVGTVVLPDPPTDFYTDYRQANQAGIVTWFVKYSVGTGELPITFSWSIAALPGAGSWALRYYDSGLDDFVTVDMRLASSATWTDTTLAQVRIRYTTTRCTITATASGNWNSAGTWNENCAGSIPSPTDDVYIPSGRTVDFNTTATTVESLTIGNGGNLTFSIANQLLVSDNAFVRGGNLTLGSMGNFSVGGALTNLGVMQQTLNVSAPTTFLNTGGYGGLAITPVTNMGNTSVRIIGGQVCDTNNTSIWHCFSVTPTTSVINAGIVFYYKANELNTSVCASMQAWRSTGGQNWISAGTAGATSCVSEPYSVSYAGVTVANTGSFFALRSPAQPTALTLRTFNAVNAGSDFPIFLIVGLVGLASLSGIVAWWASGKRKDSSSPNP